MRIQRIEAKDFSIWRDQIAELFNDSVTLNFPDVSVDGSYGEEKCNDVMDYLMDGSAIVFVATDDDKLMGWVWCHRINKLGRTRLHIAEISISKEYRQKGIGKELLDTVEKFARAKAYSEIELLVTVNNTAAVAFYKQASYVEERYQMCKHLS